jgi:hypothetical protein
MMVLLGQSNPGLNTARDDLAGAGTQTAALAFGGYKTIPPTPATAATEEYDGSTWTTSPGSLKQQETNLAGAGTQTSALAFGGSPNNSSNRRMDRCRFSINKNNHSFLTLYLFI